MSLPIAIGVNSANETFYTDIGQLPHLFLSYCYEEQVRAFFSHLVKHFNSVTTSNVRFAVATTKSSVTFDVTNGVVFPFCYVVNDDYKSTVRGKSAFMAALGKELQRRIKRLSVKREHKTSDACPPLLVLLDDVLDVVISSKKSVGLTFLQLLLMGHQVNMHVVAASSGTCRHLLRQLMQIHPIVKSKFQKLFEPSMLSVTSPLGAELVFTAEDFIFFKEANTVDYHRLYPISNKKAVSLFEVAI